MRARSLRGKNRVSPPPARIFAALCVGLSLLCAACASFETAAAKAILSAGALYDSAMKASAEAYSRGLLSDGEKEEIINRAHRAAAAIKAAKEAYLVYVSNFSQSGRTELERRLEILYESAAYLETLAEPGDENDFRQH